MKSLKQISKIASAIFWKIKKENLMTFDYKKEYKEFYLPPKKKLITLPYREKAIRMSRMVNTRMLWDCSTALLLH